MNFKKAVEQNFNIVLIISFTIGLVFPTIDIIPPSAVAILMSIIIFLSLSKVEFQKLKEINLKFTALFYLTRFIALPIVVYLLSQIIVPSFSTSVLLLSIMPAGVASIALANLLSGSIEVSLVLAVFSNLVAPAVIPIVFLLFSDSTLEVSKSAMFQALLFIVVIPFIVDWIIKLLAPQVRDKVSSLSSFLATLLMGIILIVVVNNQRDFFFSSPLYSIKSILILAILYATYYLFGIFFSRNKNNKERISYSICSGANNNALGISLSFLYFSVEISLFMVLSELTWVLALVPFKKFVTNLNSKDSS